MSKTSNLVKTEGGLVAPFGSVAAAITAAAKTLLKSEVGFVLVDATANAVAITLPAANAPLDVLVRRVDGGSNRVKVQAAGTDKIKFHTHLNAAGYPFFVLMGAGDFWHLRSDGAGGWWPISRLNTEALGRVVFDSSTQMQPGGFGDSNGATLLRADWPWLWDHAQASGMLTTEAARAGMEGGWTSGDGALTFRGPDGRGEFLRVLDNGRGIDPSRLGGSWQVGTFAVVDMPPGGTYTTSMAGEAGRTIGDYGIDPLQGNPLALKYAVASTVVTNTLANDSTSTISGNARPRNIAYPGRIKLI